MDRFGHSAPSLDELKQIQDEARSSNSLKALRVYFERVQELRRIHSGNFDVQLIVAEAQEEIIERARELRSKPGAADADDLFEKPSRPESAAQVPIEMEPDAESQPGTQRLNSKSWRRATFLALFLTAVICIVFFYLIQTARRINLSPPAAATNPKSSEPSKIPVQNTTAGEPVVSSAPAVRLYTDLIPGTVSVDDGEAQDLKDGELNLDHLEPGRHSIKVAGRSGTASFSFDVSGNGTPQPVAPVTAVNAMAVLVSAQDGKGRLLTNLQQADIALDGKPLGQAGPDGLPLDDLGVADHELQVAQANDRQRFVLTYTPAPVLTVFIKSDPNAGTVTIIAKQDNVSIFIDDKPYRRMTENGQLRIPLRAGDYVIRVHKDGFVDPPPQPVTVKKAEESELSFTLTPVPELASLEVRGAAPGTAVFVDKQQVATVGADGIATAGNVASGNHNVELRLGGAAPKTLEREFQSGKTVLISGTEAAIEAPVPETKPAEKPAAPSTPAESASIAGKPVDIPGEQVRRGGGFVHYNVPRSPGHYSFEAHGKIGGFLKHDKLQWYAGYENSENYVLFTIDGKHATIRELRSGKPAEISRIPFNIGSGEWVQVDMAIKPGIISTKIKTPETGWSDLGSVTSDGRDFTQDRMGFYIPGNDEIAIANFRFSNR